MPDPSGENLYAKYASLTHPERTIDNETYVWHNARSIVIREHYPKSKYHYRLIPRVGAAPRVPANLTDLHTLLTSGEVDKSDAETILREIREDAEAFKPQIEAQMKETEHFVWNIWMGFKAASSNGYLHLHILSDDLIGSGMKTKEQFFSFHPEHGEFYHIDEVLSWFEIVPERFEDNVRELLKMKNPNERKRRMLGEELYCYYKEGRIECPFQTKEPKAMKAHLEEEWMKRKKGATVRERNKARWEQNRAMREEQKRRNEGGKDSVATVAESTGVEEQVRHEE